MDRAADKLSVGDEAAFCEWSEQFIQKLVKTFKKIAGLERVPLIDMCLKIEDLLFQKALDESAMSSQSKVWSNGRFCCNDLASKLIQ